MSIAQPAVAGKSGAPPDPVAVTLASFDDRWQKFLAEHFEPEEPDWGLFRTAVEVWDAVVEIGGKTFYSPFLCARYGETVTFQAWAGTPGRVIFEYGGFCTMRIAREIPNQGGHHGR